MSLATKTLTSFRIESVSDALWDELLPLLDAHYREVAHFKDIPLAPIRHQYEKIEELGLLKIFTARTTNGTLIGYAAFFVTPHMHYGSSVWANMDVLFLEPSKRGRGIAEALFEYAEGLLKTFGVQVVSQHMKAAHSYGRMLERRGYELMDLIYVKRLDRE